MPKCSIIIPAHQEESYIEETLKSINHSAAETIVVANGCSDKTFDIAQKHATKIINLPKCGVSKARNEGVKYAKGKKLIFLDADVKLDKDIIQSVIDSEYSIGTCKVKPDVENMIPKILMKSKSWIHHFGTCTGLIFCDKKLFKKVKGFDEELNIGEDGKFLREAKALGNFGVVNAYAINSMRRFEKKGYLNVIAFWIKRLFVRKNEYEVVR